MSQHPYKTRSSNRQKRRHDIADTIDDIPFRPPHQKNKTNEFPSNSSSNTKIPIFSSTATQLNQEREKRSVWDEQKRSVWPQPNQPTPKQTSTLFKPTVVTAAYHPVFKMSDEEPAEYQLDTPTPSTEYQPVGFQQTQFQPTPFQQTNFQNSHQIGQTNYQRPGYQPTPFDQTAFEPTNFQEAPYEQSPSMIFQKPKHVFQKPASPVSAFQKPHKTPSSNKQFLSNSSPRSQNSTSPKSTKKSTPGPKSTPTPKPTPLYRPVKEPFHEASAYQCLVQLEQELSQECDKYNPTDSQQQLDLKDVSYMKFTEVGKELFEQTNAPRSHFTKRRRDKSSSFSMPEVYTEVNDKDYEEIDGMLEMLDSGGDQMAIRSRTRDSEKSQEQNPHRKRNSKETVESERTNDRNIKINTHTSSERNSDQQAESGYKTTTPNNFSTAFDEYPNNDQQYHQIENQENFQNNFENPHNYPKTHVQDSMLGTSISESDVGISSQNIDILSQDGGIPDFNSTRPPSESEAALDFDNGAMNFNGDLNAYSNGNIHTYENNTSESMQRNANSRELNSSESINMNGAAAVTKPDNKHHKQPTQQFVQEGHVLKLCSTPTKTTKQSDHYGFVDPSDVYPENRPRSSNSRPESTENTKFNFTIRNTEDDYRKARYVKLVERRSQVQSACENHRIMIQSLENLLNQQRAKLAHDEQTMRVLDNELSKIQDE